MKTNILQKSCFANDISLNYYEIKNDFPVLLLVHAQGTDGMSYQDTFKELSKKFHIYSMDCPGHGKSAKNKSHYRSDLQFRKMSIIHTSTSKAC